MQITYKEVIREKMVSYGSTQVIVILNELVRYLKG